MRTSIRIALATLALTPTLGLAQASGSPVSVREERPVTIQRVEDQKLASSTVGSRLTPKEEAAIAVRVSDADALVTRGRFREARTILRQVAQDQVAGGVYHAETLRRLANIEFSLDRPLAAAAILVELADAAKAVSDPVIELQALLDAAVVYGQERQAHRARELRPRITALLRSPAISEETRRAIARYLDHE